MNLSILGLVFCGLISVSQQKETGSGDTKYCGHEDKVPNLKTIGLKASVETANSCAQKCADNQYCSYFSWSMAEKVCLMYNVTMIQQENFLSGDMSCEPEDASGPVFGVPPLDIDTCSCGLPVTTENADGDARFYYPWQGGIANAGESYLNTGACVGSLISDRWFLTAAHCYPAGMPASIIEVIFRGPREDDRLKAKVSKLVHHPDYDENTYDNDFLLLKLEAKIDFEKLEWIRPVCLPGAESNTYAGEEAVSNLWEDFGDQGNNVKVLSAEECAVTDGGEYITDNMLCAGLVAGGKQDCAQDGVGLVSSGSGSEGQLIGVLSWSQGCNFLSAPDIYSRTTTALDWIKSTTEQTFFTCA